MNLSSRRFVDIAILSFAAAALLGCGDSAHEDGALSDAAHGDAGNRDAGHGDAGDISQGLPTTCEGACTEHALAVEFGGESGEFARAFYGLTAPEVSASGQWEVYIEAAQGGADGCPQQDSPSPDWSLIVSGLVMPLDDAPRTKDAGEVAVVFFDFDGRFLGEEPFVRASAASATPTAANLDKDLVAGGSSDDDGLVALELQAIFEAGEVSGHLVARHCPSLDAAVP